RTCNVLISNYLFFFLRIQHLPRSTLFPYTTLFRSGPMFGSAFNTRNACASVSSWPIRRLSQCGRKKVEQLGDLHRRLSVGTRMRSEEHTSELQSHLNLVCRLLLEKKKKNKSPSVVY